MTRDSRKANTKYSWVRDDLESRLSFSGGRFTRVNNLVWLLTAIITTLVFYGMVLALGGRAQYVYELFYERSWVQVMTVFASFWAFYLVIAKINKIKVQGKALEFRDLVPVQADFVLSAATVEQVLARMKQECNDPRKFILFNRIELALSNLKNMGRIGDVDEVLNSQAENDEDVMESSYTLVRGLIWAIPVLGFIGTVLGLSKAIGGFKSVLVGGGSDFSSVKDNLAEVVESLGTAFDTTLVALLAALAIQMLLTFVRKSEEELLDSCKEYCQRHIVSRLRITPFEDR